MDTKQIVLASRPKGMPTPDNFAYQEAILPALQEGEVLLKSIYISVDPYMRGRMKDRKSYIDPFQVDQPITGNVVACVQESQSPKLQPGDKVVGILPWATYSIAKADTLRKIPPSTIPDSYYLGIIGMPGLTAYFGLIFICEPQPGETVVVSGAAGAVGLVVGQIAKIIGCRVVGITGSDEKVQMLKGQFGFDEALNYKNNPDLAGALSRACPQGVDCYFDNVGGDITEIVMQQINTNARIAVCGQIATYNEMHLSTGLRLLPFILEKSALMQGFLVSDYKQYFPKALNQLMNWVEAGKLKYTETVLDGFDQLPEAFIGLFNGKNTGKMMVRV